MFSPAAVESGPDGLDFYGLRRKLSRGDTGVYHPLGWRIPKNQYPGIRRLPRAVKGRRRQNRAMSGDCFFPEARGFGTCCSSKEKRRTTFVTHFSSSLLFSSRQSRAPSTMGRYLHAFGLAPPFPAPGKTSTERTECSPFAQGWPRQDAGDSLSLSRMRSNGYEPTKSAADQ